MQREVFARQIDRLKSTYGDRAYPDERMKIIYNSLANYPDHYLERAVNDFIANMRQSPMLSDFVEKFSQFEVEKAEQLKANYAAMPIQKVGGVECRFCNGSGYATVRKDNYDFCTICDCSMGAQRPKMYLSPKKGDAPGEEITMLSRSEFLTKGS